MIFDSFEKIAVLIDADNAQAAKIEDVFKDVSTYGRIVTKRAYANWTKPALKPWEAEVKRFAVGTIQQFDFASGKNASDMALTVDAMDLLYSGGYDCFVIVSSDSDFTTLAIKLHESGVYVIGYGNRQTVESFRNACDEFNYVEELGVDHQEALSEENVDVLFTENSPEPSADKVQGKKPQKDKAASESALKNTKEEEDPASQMTEKELDELLKIAADKYAEDDGFVNVAAAGSYIKRVRSDFNIKSLGYEKLPAYLKEKSNKYEVVEKSGKNGAKLVMFKRKKKRK